MPSHIFKHIGIGSIDRTFIYLKTLNVVAPYHPLVVFTLARVQLCIVEVTFNYFSFPTELFFVVTLSHMNAFYFHIAVTPGIDLSV